MGASAATAAANSDGVNQPAASTSTTAWSPLTLFGGGAATSREAEASSSSSRDAKTPTTNASETALGSKDNTEEQQQQVFCPICLDTIANPADRAALSCGHVFCYSCLDRYRTTAARVAESQKLPCPCCRRAVAIPVKPAPELDYHVELALRRLAQLAATPSEGRLIGSMTPPDDWVGPGRLMVRQSSDGPRDPTERAMLQRSQSVPSLRSASVAGQRAPPSRDVDDDEPRLDDDDDDDDLEAQLRLRVIRARLRAELDRGRDQPAARRVDLLRREHHNLLNRTGAGRRVDLTADATPQQQNRLHAANRLQAQLRGASAYRFAARTDSATGDRTEAVNELRQAAGRNVVIRFCPTCQSPVIKHGGCDNMRCACGARFRWSAARPLRPCSHAHTEDGWFLSAKTCRYCSKTAHAEKYARQTVGATFCVPVVTLGVGAVISGVAVAGALAAIPAAVFGGPALLYEPIRRIRKKKHNPLAYAAASGVAVAGACVMACGYDSD